MTTKKFDVCSINEEIKDYFDLFVCASSFEERCLTIPKQLSNNPIKKVFVVEHELASAHVKQNTAILLECLSQDVSVISFDFKDPTVLVKQLMNGINSIQGDGLSVLIDVTAFTHENLLIVINYLYHNNRIRSIKCVYLNAKEYCPGLEVKKKWLSIGARKPHSVYGLAGVLLPSKKTHLIVIVGYEYHRAISVISNIEPSSLTLIHGLEDYVLTEKDKEANSFFEGLVSDMAFNYSQIDHKQIPCNDPLGTAKELISMYNTYSDKNIIIVPMNSKMSTLGVFLSVKENDNICVSYAPAVMYNETNYSIPGKECYIFDLKDN